MLNQLCHAVPPLHEVMSPAGDHIFSPKQLTDKKPVQFAHRVLTKRQTNSQINKSLQQATSVLSGKDSVGSIQSFSKQMPRRTASNNKQKVVLNQKQLGLVPHNAVPHNVTASQTLLQVAAQTNQAGQATQAQKPSGKQTANPNVIMRRASAIPGSRTTDGKHQAGLVASSRVRATPPRGLVTSRTTAVVSSHD